MNHNRVNASFMHVKPVEAPDNLLLTIPWWCFCCGSLLLYYWHSLLAHLPFSISFKLISRLSAVKEQGPVFKASFANRACLEVNSLSALSFYVSS